MKKKTLILKKISQIKIGKFLLSGLLKTVCCTAFLILNTSTLLANNYTWVGGGVSVNDMDLSTNWSPSGPPGNNDNALFTTDNNPPVLFSGDIMNINSIEFFVTGVVCTLEGDFSVENGVHNSNQVTSVFNIRNGGIFTLDGGSLASGGLSIYNLNASTLSVGSADVSSAIVNMQNESLFSVEDVLTIGSLSSTSFLDSIDLQSDLTFGDSSDQVINGVFSGTANLVKQGTGAVSLNGANTFNGLTSVNAGRLNVNGHILGDLTVFSSAVVGGTGTIGGMLSVENGGTLSPGNSIGRITIGSLSLADESTTNIEIDPNSSSQISVNGNAALGGVVNVIQNPGTYAKTGSYQIVAAGSISNNFESVIGGLPGFVFSLSTPLNEVFLNYNYTLGISTNHLSGNNLKLANYLNEFAPVSPEFVTLVGLSGGSLNTALGSVSPVRNAFATFASQETAFSLSDIVSGYLSNRRLNTACLRIDYGFDDTCSRCATDSPYTVWGGGFLQNARQSAERQNPAFQFNSQAVLVGVDYSQFPDVLFGGGLGYAHTHLTEHKHAGNASIKYCFATIYGMMNWNRFYVESALWGISHQINNDRHIHFSGFDEVAHAKYNGWQMIPHLGFGLKNKCFFGEIEPFAAFDWVINWENGFHEHGAGDLNMRQKAQASSLLQSEVGFRFYEPWIYSWGVLGAKENISYINRVPFNTGKVTAAIAGASNYLTLKSLTSSQNLAAVNLELFVQLGENQSYTTSLEYDGEFGDKYKSNAGMLRIAVEF